MRGLLCGTFAQVFWLLCRAGRLLCTGSFLPIFLGGLLWLVLDLEPKRRRHQQQHTASEGRGSSREKERVNVSVRQSEYRARECVRVSESKRKHERAQGRQTDKSTEAAATAKV